MNMAELSSLPVELIHIICGSLSKVDLYHLRLSCRVLGAKAKHQFYLRHFQVCQFMITRESLETLVQISSVKEIAKCVKELQLCMVTFSNEEKAEITGDPFTTVEKQEYSILKDIDMDVVTTKTPQQDASSYTKGLKRKRRRAYGAYTSCQFTMRKKGTDVKLLSEAMRNLPSLESVAMVNLLDDDNPPWGARKIQFAIGMWPSATSRKQDMKQWPFRRGTDRESREISRRMSTHTLAVIFGAMTISGVRLTRSLTILGAPREFHLPKTPSSRRIAPATTPAKTFSEGRITELKDVLAGVREFSLTTEDYIVPDFLVKEMFAPLMWISKYSPFLEGVQSFTYTGYVMINDPNDYRSLKLLVSSPIFPNLRYLRLESLNVDIYDLIKFMSNHRLERIAIRNCQTSYAGARAFYDRLLSDLRGLPYILSIKICQHKIQDYPFAFRNVRLFDNCTGRRLMIKEDTPEAFQRELEAVLHGLQAYNKPNMQIPHLS